ncbi:SanA/YdcF family protein [Marinoscillum pacificum]|uniref:SanA/YdcF family protein n=1 Tax=Marinoscillum pacificum TaxID=392723 RepID=UPI00215719F7|nr:ElyC/SanA/YdcF family protein [Marinoscillum pacificum]
MKILRPAIALSVLILPIILIFYANYQIEKSARNNTYQAASEIPSNKVGLVLGTSKYLQNGNINLYFKYRIDATVTLFEEGKIAFVLVSGDNGNKDYDEPTDFKNELINRGIPEDKIYLDYAGFRTLDSVVRAKEIFGQTNLTIISQRFHNERAIYLAEHFNISAIGFNAKDVNYNYGFKTRIREYFARTKAVLDVIFSVDPKFLGKRIEIS